MNSSPIDHLNEIKRIQIDLNQAINQLQNQKYWATISQLYFISADCLVLIKELEKVAPNI